MLGIITFFVLLALGYGLASGLNVATTVLSMNANKRLKIF